MEEGLKVGSTITRKCVKCGYQATTTEAATENDSSMEGTSETPEEDSM